MNNISAIILAAGRGTRMGTELPKVLHPLNSRPILFYIVNTLESLEIKNINIVVSYKKEEVKEEISKYFKVNYIEQGEPLGTGHAVKVTLDKISEDYKYILLTNGDDSAFYSPDTIKDFISSHQTSQAVISMMVVKNSEAQKMGMVIRTSNGAFDQILEYKEFIDSGKASNEHNSGMFLFNTEWLKANIDKVEKNASTGEYYITELLNIAKNKGEKINLYILKNNNEWLGINTQEDLKQANIAMEHKIND